jgi:hypothetical protein
LGANRDLLENHTGFCFRDRQQMLLRMFSSIGLCPRAHELRNEVEPRAEPSKMVPSYNEEA